MLLQTLGCMFLLELVGFFFRFIYRSGVSGWYNSSIFSLRENSIMLSMMAALIFTHKKCKWVVHPKGNQSWIFIGRTDAEAEGPIFWPPDAKSWLIWKDPDVGEDWRQEEKGKTEDEMTEWHYWLNGHEFEKTPGDSDGQGSLACYSPLGHKEADTT